MSRSSRWLAIIAAAWTCLGIVFLAAATVGQSSLMPRASVVSLVAAYALVAMRSTGWLRNPFVGTAAFAAMAGVTTAWTATSGSELPADFSIAAFLLGCFGIAASSYRGRRRLTRRYQSTRGQ